jgi:hypothetical protein
MGPFKKWKRPSEETMILEILKKLFSRFLRGDRRIVWTPSSQGDQMSLQKIAQTEAQTISL